MNNLPVCICVLRMQPGTFTDQKRASDALQQEMGITVVSCVGAGNHRVLCKSVEHSSLLSHLSSPLVAFLKFLLFPLPASYALDRGLVRFSGFTEQVSFLHSRWSMQMPTTDPCVERIRDGEVFMSKCSSYIYVYIYITLHHLKFRDHCGRGQRDCKSQK